MPLYGFMAYTEPKILKEKVLSDCPPDKALWTAHGHVLRNIYELVDSIENSNRWTFEYHVNEDKAKDDYGVWIREVLDDEELADRLAVVKVRETYLEIIKNRIHELEQAA